MKPTLRNWTLFGSLLLTLVGCGSTQGPTNRMPLEGAVLPPSGTPPRIPTAAECTCPVSASVTSASVAFTHTLVIGNSITMHPPLADIGWSYSHGMAASAPDKDYLHLLMTKLRQRTPAATVTIANGGDFEQGYWNYDLNRLSDSFKEKPDLVLVRISENISDNLVEAKNFELHYRNLLEYIAANAAPKHKIVCTTSFWNNPRSDAVIQRVAAEKGYPVACFCNLVGRQEYMAVGFRNAGVAVHPNDRGMAEIARLIWEKVQ